mmetsp:Transcript_67071/g.131535  ORF Transcript_67071/g.131535 Transcript_67071/m.131535 type:complete len:517 (-) Transcript_67071:159-1709(-)
MAWGKDPVEKSKNSRLRFRLETKNSSGGDKAENEKEEEGPVSFSCARSSSPPSAAGGEGEEEDDDTKKEVKEAHNKEYLAVNVEAAAFKPECAHHLRAQNLSASHSSTVKYSPEKGRSATPATCVQASAVRAAESMQATPHAMGSTAHAFLRTLVHLWRGTSSLRTWYSNFGPSGSAAKHPKQQKKPGMQVTRSTHAVTNPPTTRPSNGANRQMESMRASTASRCTPDTSPMSSDDPYPDLPKWRLEHGWLPRHTQHHWWPQGQLMCGHASTFSTSRRHAGHGCRCLSFRYASSARSVAVSQDDPKGAHGRHHDFEGFPLPSPAAAAAAAETPFALPELEPWYARPQRPHTKVSHVGHTKGAPALRRQHCSNPKHATKLSNAHSTQPHANHATAHAQSESCACTVRFGVDDDVDKAGCNSIASPPLMRCRLRRRRCCCRLGRIAVSHPGRQHQRVFGSFSASRFERNLRNLRSKGGGAHASPPPVCRDTDGGGVVWVCAAAAAVTNSFSTCSASSF